MSKYLKFATPAAAQAADLKSRFGLENHGLHWDGDVLFQGQRSAAYAAALDKLAAAVLADGGYRWDILSD